MKLTCRIIAETGTTEKQLEAAVLGAKMALGKLGASASITPLRNVGMFPTLPTGQVDAGVLNGQRPWDGNGMNVWVTLRDLSIVGSGGRSMNYIFGAQLRHT